MSLVPRFVLGSLDLTDYPYSIEFGSDQGAPESAVELLASLLPDGDLVSLTRRSNRTITLTVIIEGADLAAVQDAESALALECGRALNTLTIDPGDGFAAEMAFDTFAFDPKRICDDNMEIAGYRRWVLEIPAMPFRRSTTPIIDDAGTPPSSGGTLLYDAESTTGWSKWDTFPGHGGGEIGTDIDVDTVVFDEGTASVRAESQYSYSYWETTGATFWDSNDKVVGLSLDTDTGGYLSVSIKVVFEDYLEFFTPGLVQLWMTTATGGEEEILNFVAATRNANGFVNYVWPVDGGLEVTALRFLVKQSSFLSHPRKPYTWYDNVQLLPAATTDHQIVKQLTVAGSARTTGSLRIAAPSESVALGHVLAITVPSSEVPAGFQPDGRRWVTQGTTTTDATALHGNYFTPNTSLFDDSAGKPIFDVPVGTLSAGAYTMVAAVKAESSSLTFGVQASLLVGGSVVASAPTSEATVTATGLTTEWQLIPVGTVYLPPLPVRDAEDTAVRLLFKGAKMTDVYFIPAWEVGGSPVADFSIVDCGTGTVELGGASSSLWIDSPSATQPQGGWWRGPTDDRLNSQSAWPDAQKPGIHTFKPGSLTAFVVSTGASGPTVTLEYFDRYL